MTGSASNRKKAPRALDGPGFRRGTAGVPAFGALLGTAGFCGVGFLRCIPAVLPGTEVTTVPRACVGVLE